MQSLKSFVESQRFERAIIILIIINAITLGMETSPALMDAIGPVLLTIDRLILAVFVVELMISSPSTGSTSSKARGASST